MKIKKYFFIPFFLFISCFPFFSLSLEELFSAETIAELKKNSELSLIHPEGENKPSLLPDTQFSGYISRIREGRDQKRVHFFSEFLYSVPKEKLLSENSKRDIGVRDLSIILRSISKMEGMRYHVGEKGKEKGEVLYKRTYMIAEPESDEPIADRNTGSADGQLSYCYQHDHTYGHIKYRLEYRESDDEVMASFTNITNVKVLGIKMIAPENLNINIIAFPAGYNVMLYLMCEISARNIALINVRKQLTESMTDRVTAIYGWFLTQFKEGK